MGVLVEERAWRDKVFINRKYLDLLSSDSHDYVPYASASAKPPPKSGRTA
jgi:hypothetical protein